uniref:Uncharacterized protein n=1 Tax=Magallana gigas TaxID=29159 RepID=A0A8W8NKK4_MAGGI
MLAFLLPRHPMLTVTAAELHLCISTWRPGPFFISGWTYGTSCAAFPMAAPLISINCTMCKRLHLSGKLSSPYEQVYSRTPGKGHQFPGELLGIEYLNSQTGEGVTDYRGAVRILADDADLWRRKTQSILKQMNDSMNNRRRCWIPHCL